MAKRKNALEEAQSLFGRIQQGASKVAGGIVNRVAQTPLINFTPAGSAVQRAIQVRNQYMPQLQRVAPQVANVVRNVPLNFTPTIGQYAQNQIIKPLSVLGNTRQPLPQRAISGVQGFSALTPIGAAYNLIGGGVAGAARSIRTGQPLEQSVRTGMVQPTSLGSEGLGIKNPLLALGVDVLTGNPKQALTGVKGVKGLVRGIKDLRQSPMLQEEIAGVSKALERHANLFNTANKDYFFSGQQLKDEKMIRDLAASYLGKQFAKNRDLNMVARELVKRVRQDVTSLPKMGLVDKSSVANPPLNDISQSSDPLVKQALSGQRESFRLSDEKTIRKIVGADNRITLNPNLKPNDTVSVYRAGSGEIKAGDFVSPNWNVAQEYKALRPNTNILETKVKVKDLVYAGNNAGFNYAPKSSPSTPPLSDIKVSGLKPQQSLKEILRQPAGKQGQGLVQGLSQIPPTGGTSGPKSVSQISSYFNVKNYNIPNQAKQKITQTVGEVRSDIEKAIGETLTNEEAVNFAKKTNQVLEKTVGRDQTLAWESSLIKARQNLSVASKNGVIDQDYIDNLLTIKTQGTDIARKLQSFGIGADPLEQTFKEKILEAVLKVNQNTDEILQKAQGVDFNDYKQAVGFYRQFVQPTLKDYSNLIRYNSMLSSPITHIVNTTSNALNVGLVAPIEKTLTGTIDFLNPVRIVKGQPQKNFAREGAVYSAGTIKSFGDAAHKFADVLRGKIGTENLDVNYIPLATGRRTALLSMPTRLLEASDQFFTTLARGGETATLKVRQAKGINVGNIETEALRKAKYRTFRSDLFDKDQGTLLNAVDELTQKILSLRNSKNPIVNTISNFTLPFVKTPMNILKQGIEFSPAGFGTLPGAANKTQQLSKAILGTTGAAAAAAFIASGRTTWAEPTDPTNRARFRAAGLQSYSVKIGDKWVSFQKLPPALTFPFAFMAALHDAKQKKTIDQSTFDSVLSALAKFGNFYSDQSYLKNIGDLVSATKGGPEAAVQLVGNYPQQLIPFRALLGWMARLTDPIQRKVNTDAGFIEKQVQNLLKELPIGSRFIPARQDEFGQPIPNQNRFQNAFSPFRMTTERPEEKNIYDIKQRESLFNKNIKAAEAMMEQGKPVNFGDIAGASEGEPTTINLERTNGQTEFVGQASQPTAQDLQTELQEKIIKKKVDTTGEPTEVNGKLYYKRFNSVKTIDLTSKLEEPKFTGNTELDKRALSDFSSQITKKKNEIEDLIGLGKFTPQQGETLLQGLTQKLNNVKDSRKPQISQELTGDPVIDKAIISRQKGALTAQINEIVDYVQEGKLTAEQGRSLIDRLKAKNSRLRVGGGGRKARKVSYKGVRTTAKPIKAQTLKLKIPKTRIPKYKPIKPLKIRRVSGNL